MHDSVWLRVGFIAFGLFLLVYLWLRARIAFSERKRPIAGLVYFLLILSAIAYRFVPIGSGNWGMALFAWSGIWIVMLSHWLFVVFLLEVGSGLVWLQNRVMGGGGRKRDLWKSISRQRDYWIPVALGVVVVWTALTGYFGWKHQLNFQVHEVHRVVAKPSTQPVRIAVISDIHFDPLFQLDKWQRLLDTLEARKPDLIVLLGDISDLSIHDMESLHLDRDLRALHAPLGVFALTGNHEAYRIGNDPELMHWYSKQGIQWLRDETICLTPVCITGREDLTMAKELGHFRFALPAIAPDPVSAASRPWILLDHQPKELYDFDVQGLPSMPDLGISGHTHAGQFAPWIWSVRLFWPLSRGEGTLSGIPWIITSGFGQWGPAVREGSQTEILLLTIQGDGKK